MDIKNRIQTFIQLGEILAAFPVPANGRADHLLAEAAVRAGAANPWFTNDNIRFALNALGEVMRADKLYEWMEPYRGLMENSCQNKKTIGVVTAGNIPLAGFHDFLCVLLSGQVFCGKLSAQDNVLLPAIAGILETLDPAWKEFICLTDKPFRNVDAIIATGSDNTFRYFEYYFARFPHIIRRNRNGVAVIHGNENGGQLSGLASDVMMYFGLGCRSVSKLFVPRGYDLMTLMPSFEPWNHLIRHNKYCNNYDYQKSIRIVNKQKFFDFGNLLLTMDDSLSSPVSVLNYEYYDSPDALSERLSLESPNIQCVVSGSDPGVSFILPGTAQKPSLGDYADGTDTLGFLLNEI